MRFTFPLLLTVAACGGSEQAGSVDGSEETRPVDWSHAEFEQIDELAHTWNFDACMSLSPDGSALALSSSDSAPIQVWRPTQGSVSELPDVLAIAPGPNADRFYCLKESHEVGYGLHEYSASSESWMPVRSEIESLAWADRLEMSPSDRRFLSYAQGRPTLHPFAVSHAVHDANFQVLEPLPEFDFLAALRWVDEDHFLVFGSPAECGNRPVDYDQNASIHLIASNGESIRRISNRQFDPLLEEEQRKLVSNHLLVAFPQRLSIAPDGKSLVYSASLNDMGRLGRLSIPELKHTHGRNDIDVADMLHLSPDLLLISPVGPDAQLELWDATTLKRIRVLAIPAGEAIAVSDDQSTLVVAGTKRIRAYR